MAQPESDGGAGPEGDGPSSRTPRLACAIDAPYPPGGADAGLVIRTEGAGLACPDARPDCRDRPLRLLASQAATVRPARPTVEWPSRSSPVAVGSPDTLG